MQRTAAAVMLVLALMLSACGEGATTDPEEATPAPTPGTTPGTAPGAVEPGATEPGEGTGPGPDPFAPGIDEAPTPTPAADETAGEDGDAVTQADAELGAECANDRWSIAYPEDWVTNEEPADELPPCSLFDPDSVELPDHLEVPLEIAVFARIDPVEFTDVGGDDPFAERLDEREATVEGRDAVRIESEATGDGLYPEGTLTTLWAVDLGDGETFIATTHDEGDPAYEEKQEVLDAMIESLTFEG